MASIVNVCYNNFEFALATNVYDDTNMTIPSADGWYSFGNIYRYATGGVLGPVQDCAEDCDTGGDIPCGTSISAAGEQGQYKMSFNAGIDTGAVIVKFFVATIPDRCTWEYDGDAASEYSSLGEGYLQGLIGGATDSANCGAYIAGNGIGNPPVVILSGTFTQPILPGNGSNGATYPATNIESSWPAYQPPAQNPAYLFNAPVNYIWEYNPDVVSNFSNTFVNVTMGPYASQADGGVTITSGSPGEAFMVIPKPNVSPSEINFTIDGPCGSTGWTIQVYCARELQRFEVGPAGGACGLGGTFMYYCSVDPASDGTATVIGLHDWVFQDANGVAAFPAGMYPVTMGGVDYCVTISDDGIVTAIAVCAGTCV